MFGKCRCLHHSQMHLHPSLWSSWLPPPSLQDTSPMPLLLSGNIQFSYVAFEMDCRTWHHPWQMYFVLDQIFVFANIYSLFSLEKTSSINPGRSSSIKLDLDHNLIGGYKIKSRIDEHDYQWITISAAFQTLWNVCIKELENYFKFNSWCDKCTIECQNIGKKTTLMWNFLLIQSSDWCGRKTQLFFW